MNTTSAAATLLMLGLLAGCGGGGSSDGDDGFPPAPSSFDNLADRASVLLTDSADLSFTDPGSLPTSGVARYDGVMALDGAFIEGEAQTMVGDVRIEARFANNSVGGAATNFVTETDQRLTGTLAVTNGSIDRGADPATDATFVADLRGDLTEPSGGLIEIDAGLGGAFLGSDYSYVFGGVGGVVTDGAGTGDLTGAFIARR